MWERILEPVIRLEDGCILPSPAKRSIRWCRHKFCHHTDRCVGESTRIRFLKVKLCWMSGWSNVRNIPANQCCPWGEINGPLYSGLFREISFNGHSKPQKLRSRSLKHGYAPSAPRYQYLGSRVNLMAHLELICWEVTGETAVVTQYLRKDWKTFGDPDTWSLSLWLGPGYSKYLSTDTWRLQQNVLLLIFNLIIYRLYYPPEMMSILHIKKETTLYNEVHKMCVESYIHRHNFHFLQYA